MWTLPPPGERSRRERHPCDPTLASPHEALFVTSSRSARGTGGFAGTIRYLHGLRVRSVSTTLGEVRSKPPRPSHPKPTVNGRTSGQSRQLHAVLDGVREGCDVHTRRRNDPVEFVHRYVDPADREIVAVIASSLAFGNVKALYAKIDDALGRLGPEPAKTADDGELVHARLIGWKHRVFRDRDLARLVIGSRRVQRAEGSLGQALSKGLERTGSLRLALSAWVAAIRTHGGLDANGGEDGARGASHILADPAKGSAVKRLMLLLRWMARPADGVDLGAWAIPTQTLLIPVDTHIHKLSQNLGLTRRKDVSWKTAEEITTALKVFDPLDPVKYDFSLCHLGMLQHCPSKQDPERCHGCGLQSVCRHWASGPAAPALAPPRRRGP